MVPNVRQLLNNRHHRGRSWIGCGMHRSDAAGARAWGCTSAGIHEEDTVLETCQRRVAGAGASETLARFERLEMNAQDFDFRFERLPRQAQLGRRTGWA